MSCFLKSILHLQPNEKFFIPLPLQNFTSNNRNILKHVTVKLQIFQIARARVWMVVNLVLAGTAWPLKWRRERNVGEVVLHLKATPVVKVDGKIGIRLEVKN